MIALPLALALTLAATAGATGNSAGSMGARALMLFLLALTIAAFFAALATRAGLTAVNLPSGAVASLPTLPLSADAAASAQPAAQSWWLSIIPRNIFAAAARGDIFPLLLCAIVFGIAVAKLPDDQRLPMSRAFSATSHALMIVVRWLLVLTPLGVFALSFLIALAHRHVVGERVGRVSRASRRHHAALRGVALSDQRLAWPNDVPRIRSRGVPGAGRRREHALITRGIAGAGRRREAHTWGSPPPPRTSFCR